jgi:glutamine synthetase
MRRVSPVSKIDIATLKSMVQGGEVDTVIIAAADMQSRFFGKRCCADFFLAEAIHGINICSNNLARVDSIDVFYYCPSSETYCHGYR